MGIQAFVGLHARVEYWPQMNGVARVGIQNRWELAPGGSDLNRDMPQKDLDLIQLSSRSVAAPSASPTKVVRR